MAACPVSFTPAISRRRPLVLTQRRLEANRRNATRSSGPRTAQGKAKVARNAIKHGFFAALEKWTPRQQRDFAELLNGLRDDFRPEGALEESCIITMAQSYVRMAALWHYENLAALKYHQQQEREMDERIAGADASEAAHLRASREKLRRAGLWQPTIPGPREARRIIRYGGSLDRSIHRAADDLRILKSVRTGGSSSMTKVRKQTHFPASPGSGHEAAARSPKAPTTTAKVQNQTHFSPSVTVAENAKTNPLSSMFTGNRHERRRAKALASRRR